MLGMVIQGLIEFSAPCNHCGRPFIKSQAGNLRLGVNIVPLMLWSLLTILIEFDVWKTFNHKKKEVAGVKSRKKALGPEPPTQGP